MISSDHIRPFLTNTIEKTDFPDLGERYQGKVRDVYTQDDKRILIATDRQSAFDINWCTIPLKGQVLNQLSAWWFDQVSDVLPTQVIDVPDPNTMVVKNLKMVPVEIVVRSYLTGSTNTSAWVNYKKGVRKFCGNDLPDGMVKNQKLPATIITPTTKAEEDELIDPEGIVTGGLATEEEWEAIMEKAFALFAKGQEIAAKRGLILVDTKYEMGYDREGNLCIADEVHTPDSSRYWIKETYQKRFDRGEEPQALDKELFRLWLTEQGFDPDRPKETRPAVTDNARVLLAERYIDLYERMTGERFKIEEGDVLGRMEKNLEKYRVKTAV
jgi:phosphoribosylaminoimidazole-succinocarboxamide synthase